MPAQIFVIESIIITPIIDTTEGISAKHNAEPPKPIIVHVLLIVKV